jgi:hypothetical protein
MSDEWSVDLADRQGLKPDESESESEEAALTHGSLLNSLRTARP